MAGGPPTLDGAVTMARMRRIAALSFALLVVGACASATPLAPPPEPVAPPADPGVFAWIIADGRRDRLEEPLRVRDAAARLIVELAVTAEGQGAVLDARDVTLATVAQRLRALAAEVTAGLDEQRAPGDLAALCSWADVTVSEESRRGWPGTPARGEAATFELTRRGAGALRLAVEGIDEERQGRVDRALDALIVTWGPAATTPRLEARVLGGAGRAVTAFVSFDGGEPLRLSSPRLGGLLTKADARFYRPLAELYERSGALATRVTQARRPGTPEGTFFPPAGPAGEPKR